MQNITSMDLMQKSRCFEINKNKNLLFVGKLDPNFSRTFGNLDEVHSIFGHMLMVARITTMIDSP